jgi:sporulation protein YlmC with PRC-barrel domain
MRGDDVAPPAETSHLVEVDSLRGITVFSSSGKKLGVLDGVVVSKNHGAIAYAVVCRTSLMGLRKERQLVPQDALSVDAERGGFTVVDGRFAVGDEPTKEPEREALPAVAAHCRLDPARSV